MQQRFLNNDFYSVPFVAEIDVNFEKMTKEKTQYKIIDLNEYAKTGSSFPRGVIHRNKF